jgi:hypothetical protein
MDSALPVLLLHLIIRRSGMPYAVSYLYSPLFQPKTSSKDPLQEVRIISTHQHHRYHHLEGRYRLEKYQ